MDEIYTAISECQELYPDPELSSDSEASCEGEEAEIEDNNVEGFFTNEDGLQHLTVEGEAVLAHLESILRLSSDDHANNGTHLIIIIMH